MSLLKTTQMFSSATLISTTFYFKHGINMDKHIDSKSKPLGLYLLSLFMRMWPENLLNQLKVLNSFIIRNIEVKSRKNYGNTTGTFLQMFYATTTCRQNVNDWIVPDNQMNESASSNSNLTDHISQTDNYSAFVSDGSLPMAWSVDSTS